MSGQTVVVSQQQHRPASKLALGQAARWQVRYIRTTACVDLVCMLAAASLAMNVRFVDINYRPRAYLIITLMLPVLWVLTIAVFDGYDVRFIGVGADEFRKVFNAGLCLTAGAAVVSYLTKFELARGYVAIALPTAMLLNLLARYLLRKQLHKRRMAGRAMQWVVAVGHLDSVADLIAELGREPHHGLSVVGACLTGHGGRPATIGGVPVLGGIDETTYAVDLLRADTVAVAACPELSGARMRELTWELEKSGTNVFVAPTLLNIAESRTTIRPIAGLALLHVEHTRRAGARILVKELFDRAAAALALLMLSPLFATIALAVMTDDGGPVFFKQIRIGRGGAPFKVWKFRTMITDAERIKPELAERNDGNGALFKMRQDPRVTRPGAWLRRFSLDELPQLINVMRGEMSLVGPRPALPEETANYDGTHMIRRIVVKPGITGLWQIRGRSDLSVEDSMRLDVHYVENWSLFLDLQILWKTGRAVLNGSGAY